MIACGFVQPEPFEYGVYEFLGTFDGHSAVLVWTYPNPEVAVSGPFPHDVEHRMVQSGIRVNEVPSAVLAGFTTHRATGILGLRAESEMLGGDEQVLQGTAQADVQFPLIGIGDLEPTAFVQEQIDPVGGDVETPRLRVVAGGSEDGIADKEPEAVG